MKAVFALLGLFFTSSISAQQYYQVTTEVLNVRASATKNSEIISKLNLGDSIYIVDNSSGWSKVRFEDDNYGYVSSKFISKDFKTYSKKLAVKEEETTSVWGTLAVLAFICLGWFFKGPSKSTASIRERDLPKPKLVFWFGCEHCGHIVKQGSTPSSLGCPTEKNKRHRWHKLAELGDTNYQCENCGTHVYAKSTPSSLGCPTDKHNRHRWHRL